MTTMDAQLHHTFSNSLSQNKIFEQQYYNKFIAPVLRFEGYTPVDLRDDAYYQKLDIDFGGAIDGKIQKTIEVKFDHVAAVTGNLFLETVSVDNGSNKQSPGCFLISQAEQFHQIVVLNNQIYISNLQKMREYWYGDEAVPRILHYEYAKYAMRDVRVRNKNYDSIGDCVSIDLLFGEAHEHYKHYLIDIYEFSDKILRDFVPLSAQIVDQFHSLKQDDAKLRYPAQVTKWLP